VFRPAEVEQSIPERFETQVARTPDRLAVKSPSVELTYGELNEAANRLARLLVARSGTTEEPVALLCEVGADALVAMLGILKAGKFYVPLDPEDSPSRLAQVLEDVAPGLILTDEGNLSLASTLARSGSTALSLSTELGEYATENLEEKPSPDAAAYVFFTSGSTGRPKGVVDTHRNVLHNVMRYTNQLHVSAEDRLTLLQSTSASGSVSNIFGALLTGASVHPWNVRGPGGHRVAEFLHANRITIYHSVPAIFRSFLTDEVAFPNLRLVRLEGDQSTAIDVELYRKHFSSTCLLAIGLGATETGLSRQFLIDKSTQLEGGSVPIGYPVQDMHVVLVDAEGVEVETGQTGEICVRSRFLARGYWKRPDLTKAAFLPDPKGEDERTYRSGDLGRLHSDGCLEFLGRKDFRVKIRGHFVEPHEVEDALLALGSIQEAVVGTTRDATADNRLVAYVVPNPEARPRTTNLQRQLREKLPAHAIPAHFQFLEALPLTKNGKLDRRKLLSLEVAETRREGAVITPRNELETHLVRVWKNILELSTVGVTDGFLELGGDSVRAVRLLNELEKSFGRELPLASLLEAPTVERMAALLQDQDWAPSWMALVPLAARGSKSPFFCVPGADGQALMYRDLPRLLDPDRPVFGFQSLGLDGRHPPLRTIREMAAIYVQEMRRVQPQGPYFLGGHCFGAFVALEMACCLEEQGEEVGLLAVFDTDATERTATTPGQKLRLFWKHLADASLRQKLAHIRTCFAFATMRVKQTIAKGGCHIFAALGRKLPQALRGMHVVELNYQAARQYHPRVFQGRAAFFQASAHSFANPRRFWDTWVARGFWQCETVPGNDFTMFMEPQAAVLAEKLRASLDEAEGLSQDDPSHDGA